MDNNPLFESRFSIHSENQGYEAGLCISNASLEWLKTKKKEFLHEKELLYFATLFHSKRQFSYLLGRFCAKNAVHLLCQDRTRDTVCIENGVFQQPLISQPNLNMQISITHAESIGGALAFSEACPMALDIETIRHDRIETIQTQLTKEEKQKISSLDYDKAMLFTTFWTMKEALSKVLKCGMTVPFELLEVKNFSQKKHYFESEYTHFAQYRTLSFFLNGSMCSLVYPKNTTLNVNIPSTLTENFAKTG